MADNRTDYLEASFGAEASKYNNCQCGGCHRVSYVLKLQIPRTLYHNGRELSTQYEALWLCKRCVDKLRAALDTPMGEVQDGE